MYRRDKKLSFSVVFPDRVKKVTFKKNKYVSNNKTDIIFLEKCIM